MAVLTGSGGTFCAGADLKAMAEGDKRPVRDNGPGPMGPTRLDLSKPVIAAIEGHAVAGGLELALWCDLRVAATDAVLGVYCRRFGVPLVDGGSVRLATSRRTEPCPRPASHRPRHRRARGPGDGSREPTRCSRAKLSGWRSTLPARSRRFHRSACETTEGRCSTNGG